MSLVQRRQGHSQHLPLVDRGNLQPESPLGRGGLRNDRNASGGSSLFLREDHRSSPTESSDETSRQLIIMGYQHLLCFVIFMYTLLMIGRIGFGWIPGEKPMVGRNDDLVPIEHDMVTVVTAYFSIPSKRPSSEYAGWMNHMMLIEDNMVIFCEPDLVHVLQEVRQHRPTHFVPMTLNETVFVRYHGMADLDKDQSKLGPEPEKVLHSKESLVVWNEKLHFLEKAMEIDAFPIAPGFGRESSSERFFAWVDIEYLRNDLLDYKRMVRYLPKQLRENQSLFLDLRPLVKQDRLCSGFIGGYTKGLQRWIREYYTILDANRDHSLGKDSLWMYQTCANNPELCILVPANDRYGDARSYMAPYLHGVQYWGISDRLRRVWEKSILRMLWRWAVEPRLDVSVLTV